MARSNDGEVCMFCKRADVDSSIVGECYRRGSLIVHQYCLYFSSGLAQRSDEQDEANAICGFLVDDIIKELGRGTALKCVGCGKPGGYVGCMVKSCRKAGHFPCLHELDFTFHYDGNFEAYCPKHCPTQPKLLYSNISTDCCICLCSLSSVQRPQQIYCPCCFTTFHKACIQKQALSAGFYYLRCPVCKNKEAYCSEVIRMGIAVPTRDAEWEQDMHYYPEELHCHAHICLCPQGRAYHTQIGKYRMRKCWTCGQCRGHVDCLRGEGVTECEDCFSPVQEGSPSSQPACHGRDKDVLPKECSSTSNYNSCHSITTLKIPVLSLKKLTADDILFINTSLQ